MVQSLSMKEYPEDTFTSFGLAVFDDVIIWEQKYSKAMPKVASKYMLGLSATPNRKDGLERFLSGILVIWFICPKDIEEDNIEVNIIEYYDETEIIVKKS